MVHETEHWRSALNINQNLLGKTIIVLRRHLEDVTQLRDDEWSALLEETTFLTARLRSAFAPEHFNYAFLQNQDRHVHLHVIPRYAARRVLGDLEFDDPDYPSHYRVPAPQRLVGEDVLAAIAEALSA